MTSGREYYTPIRPPRGTKVSRDTSGRLMNIIAELSVSKSSDERQTKMKQLKEDFESSDAKLIELIAENREYLILIMEAFSTISAKLSTSRRGCVDVKEKLHLCQKLLECKREDIRRLWFESMEHREVISMLKKIDDLSKVRDKVQSALNEGKFAEANEILVSKISLLDLKLNSVEALNDVKVELNSLLETLHQVLVDELHKHIYMLPEGVFLRVDKKRNKNYVYEDIFKQEVLKCELPIGNVKYNFQKEMPNYEHISLILNCISKLNRLPETVEILKARCQKELMSIVRNSSQLMCEILHNSSYSVNQKYSNTEENFFLLDLLTCILHQFKYVAINHHALFDNLKKVTASNVRDTESYYGIEDVYSKIQAAIEVFLSAYIDFQNTNAAVSQSVSATSFAKVPTTLSTDISSFFLRKEVNRTKKKHALFKFDGSSHAISVKSYLQEKDSMKEKNELDSEGDLQSVLVCEPMARNITIIFLPLKKFICELETALNLEKYGAHCPLHSFLMDYVKLFLDEVNFEISRLIEKNVHRLETLSFETGVEELKLAGAQTEILNSTLALNSCLEDLKFYIKSLPDFSAHFLQLLINVLQTYKEECYAAYKGLICSHSADDRSVFSINWARDEDISRLLRSLPNWANLKVEENIPHNTHEFEESPEEIRFRNKEESELLIRNLSSSKEFVSDCEIISDHNKLKNLALMHESMEWFTSKVLEFAERLPDIQASLPSLIPEKFIDETENEAKIGMSIKACLKKLAKEFEDLGDSCLLVLHLEVRAHCFYYLFPLSKEGNYSNRKEEEEPEKEVLKLNADLCQIDEALAPVLKPKKMKYIFEGLGELLATILINSILNIKKINENGVKKMGRNIFAIQQNLAGITMTREVALDRARQYFDLLNHSFEDILNQIVEEGPQFQEQEYSAIIQLLYNSREGMDSLNNYREKLRQILDEVAVSV